MTTEDRPRTPEQDAKRTPDETDDLDAIVRFHGANEVLDALLRAAAEAYGKDDAGDNLARLMFLGVERLTEDGGDHETDGESSYPEGAAEPIQSCVIHTETTCTVGCIGRVYPPCVDKACSAEVAGDCRYPGWRMCAFPASRPGTEGGA